MPTAKRSGETAQEHKHDGSTREQLINGDGYTLCVIYHSTMSYNPVQFASLPYDPDKDIVPITRLFFLIESLAVTPALDARSGGGCAMSKTTRSE